MPVPGVVRARCAIRHCTAVAYEGLTGADCWQTDGEYFFCPKHASAPDRYAEDLQRHARERAEALADYEQRWDIENPAPLSLWVKR